MRSTLLEGLIKIPADMLDEITKFFIYWYLVHLKYKLNTEFKLHFDEDDIDVIEQGIATLAKKNNVKYPSDSDLKNTKVLKKGVSKKIKIGEMPDAYIQKLLRKTGEKHVENLDNFALGIVIAFDKSEWIPDSISRGMFYTKTDDEDPVLALSVKNMDMKTGKVLQMLSSFRYNVVELELKKFSGIIEHELTHFVQDSILQFLHPKQTSSQGHSASRLSKDEANLDKYYTQLDEFDPWIKTSIRNVEALFTRFKAKTDIEKKAIIEKYTLSDIVSSKVDDVKIDDTRSMFFKSLRRSNPTKWKKAVKLLYSSLN